MGLRDIKELVLMTLWFIGIIAAGTVVGIKASEWFQ